MCKKFYRIAAIVGVLAVMLSGYAFAGEYTFSGGSGTESDPYQIKTTQDLYNVRHDLDAHYILKNDIVFNSSTWETIEDDFEGVLDGNGYSIQGLKLGNALFHRVSEGTIKNLTLSNCDINLIGQVGGYAGSLVNHLQEDSSVTNCNLNGTVTVSENISADKVGGLVGRIGKGAEVRKCVNNANITSKSNIAWVGGLVGYSEGTMVICTNNGNISGMAGTAGIAGYQEGRVDICTNNGDISSKGVQPAGGLFAMACESIIENCENNGSVVSTNSLVGGILGDGCKNSFSSCYNNGNITSNRSHVGGIVGLSEDSSYLESYNKGKITGLNGVGGIVGGDINGRISYCGNRGVIAPLEDGEAIGGIAGWSSESELKGCTNYSDIQAKSSLVGGLVGSVDSGIIKTSSNEGKVATTSGTVGGLVGLLNYGTVSGCCNNGFIEGIGNVGGLVGSSESGVISDCYNSGKVSSEDVDTAGGIVGFITGLDSMKNTYNVGRVSGNKGIFGTKDSSIDVVTNCYVFPEANVYNIGGIKNLPSNRYLERTDFVGFDFEETWYFENTPMLYGIESELASALKPIVPATMAVGESAQAKIKGDIYSGAIWHSRDEGVVTVDKDGKLTAVRAGETTIDVEYTCTGQTDCVSIKVVAVPEGDNDGDEGDSEGSDSSGMGSDSPIPEVTVKDIKDLNIKLQYTEVLYDGSSKKPTVFIDGLKEGVDYTVSYKNNINAGKASVVISGKGDYKGSVTKEFTISPKDISGMEVVLNATEFMYTGSTVNIEASVPGLVNGRDADYVVHTYYPDNFLGRVEVEVVGTGNYTGRITTYVTIVKAKPVVKAQSKVSVSLYGHNDIKVKWSTQKVGNDKVYYKVEYKQYGGKWKVLKSKVTGSSLKKANLLNGKRYCFRVTPYVIVDSVKYAGKSKTSSYIYTLKKVAKPTVKKSGSLVKVSWKNIQGETGYQISRSPKKNSTQIILNYKTTKGTYKKLSVPKGKTYYYKVRAYKVVNGQKVFGPWSKVTAFKR